MAAKSGRKVNKPGVHPERIVNWYKTIDDKFKSHQDLEGYENYENIKLPSIMRCIICGASGSMKTNTLLTILLNMGCWTKIYLYCKLPDEPLYVFLTSIMQEVGKKFKTELIVVSTNIADVPTPAELDPRHRSLFIIDDQAAEKKSKLEKVEELYTWTRKYGEGVSFVWITQQFSKAPFFVRNNSDVIIMKRINQTRDLAFVLSQYTLDNSLEEMKEMYRQAMEGAPENFFVLDLTKGSDDPYRFRKNFSPLNNGSA
jgi:hypothetical protein